MKNGQGIKKERKEEDDEEEEEVVAVEAEQVLERRLG